MAKTISFRIPKTHHEVRFSIELAAIFATFALCVVSFAKIANEVVERESIHFDLPILHWVHSLASPALDRIVPIMTDIGGPIGGALLAGIVTVIFWLKGKKREAYVLAFSSAGAAILNVLLKVTFMRARPDEWTRLVTENSYSFPSGHAMASAALGFALVAVLWRTKYRWDAMIGATIYVLLIGFTRLYLGVHYPSDILAGWLLSAAWTSLVVVMMYRRLSRRNDLTN